VTFCDPSQQVRSVRRYYLLERLAACARDDFAIASVFRAKQEAEPATPLPADFPSRAVLVAAGYSTVEDINGADLEELQCARLTTKQAVTVLTELAALL
jgi:hypothetical protein